MTTASVVLEVRDASYQLVHRIDAWRSCQLEQPHLGTSAMMLELPAGSDAWEALALPGAGVWVVIDGVIVDTLVREGRGGKRSGKTRTNTAKFKGDGWFLDNDLCFPEAPALTTATDATYLVTGAAETALKTLVDVNCGPSAAPERYVIDVEADYARGPVTTTEHRFETVAAGAYRIARLGGLAVAVRQAVEGSRPVLTVREVVDRTSTLVLREEDGSIGDFNWEVTDPRWTRVLLAGQGEGTGRVLLEVADVLAEGLLGVQRRTFIDARTTTDLAALEAQGLKKVAEGQSKAQVSFTATGLGLARPAVDYNLGDLATVQVDGESFTVEAAQFSWSLSPWAYQVKPVWVTAGATVHRPVFGAVQAIEDRVAGLERI